MKKNLLTKKTVKRLTKKNAAQLREDKITEILNMVSEICDYAIDNLCTEPAQMEELEWKLRKYIK